MRILVRSGAYHSVSLLHNSPNVLAAIRNETTVRLLTSFLLSSHGAHQLLLVVLG